MRELSTADIEDRRPVIDTDSSISEYARGGVSEKQVIHTYAQVRLSVEAAIIGMRATIKSGAVAQASWRTIYSKGYREQRGSRPKGLIAVSTYDLETG